jgi:hypothetical protein
MHQLQYLPLATLSLALLYVACQRVGLEFSRSVLGRLFILLAIIGSAKYDRCLSVLVAGFFVVLAKYSPLGINVYNEGFTPDANLHTLGGAEETGSFNVKQQQKQPPPPPAVSQSAGDELLSVAAYLQPKNSAKQIR